MNYLGIDYGDAQVGVALAAGPLAEPLLTVATKNSISVLKNEIGKHGVGKIVVGDCPEEYFQQLRNLGIEVEQVDETLSSHDARQALMHTGQKKRREKEHATAAAIILQSWLDFGSEKI